MDNGKRVGHTDTMNQNSHSSGEVNRELARYLQSRLAELRRKEGRHIPQIEIGRRVYHELGQDRTDNYIGSYMSRVFQGQRNLIRSREFVRVLGQVLDPDDPERILELTGHLDRRDAPHVEELDAWRRVEVRRVSLSDWLDSDPRLSAGRKQLLKDQYRRFGLDPDRPPPQDPGGRTVRR